MAKRGYPMGDFERMAADISVDHPTVIATYRAAQAIAARDARGEADTEELRKAVIYYRTLFDELLGVAPEKIADSARRAPRSGALMSPQMNGEPRDAADRGGGESAPHPDHGSVDPRRSTATRANQYRRL